ncbi:hypothetical protein ACMA5I_01020 [Paracoccaceae bacterium GXU_MW_L88]
MIRFLLIPALVAGCTAISPNPPPGVSQAVHDQCRDQAQRAAIRPQAAVGIAVGRKVRPSTAVGIVNDMDRGQDAYLRCIRNAGTPAINAPIVLTETERAAWSTLSPAEQQAAAAHIRAGGTLESYLKSRGA